MAFTQASAPEGPRVAASLSADNTLPERHILIETLRRAAPLLGLKPPVLATLDAMLSCLAPKRNHHVVFASNATLTFRRNGITDRTLRRHVETLIDAKLLQRRDSPNRKRFTRYNNTKGTALRFGFDLAPLFARLAEIAALATEACAEREQITYLRSQLRATLQLHPDHLMADHARKHLRRKTTSAELATLLAEFPSGDLEAPATPESITPAKTNKTSDTSGKNVRHHHKSNIELNDKERSNITITSLKLACPEALQYAVSEIQTVEDVIAHAKTLAPMLGIDTANYESAQNRLGPLATAVTIWALLQYHTSIHSLGAYFRSLTTGSKSVGFNPFNLIRQLCKRHAIA